MRFFFPFELGFWLLSWVNVLCKLDWISCLYLLIVCFSLVVCTFLFRLMLPLSIAWVFMSLCFGLKGQSYTSERVLGTLFFSYFLCVFFLGVVFIKCSPSFCSLSFLGGFALASRVKEVKYSSFTLCNEPLSTPYFNYFLSCIPWGCIHHCNSAVIFSIFLNSICLLNYSKYVYAEISDSSLMTVNLENWSGCCTLSTTSFSI